MPIVKKISSCYGNVRFSIGIRMKEKAWSCQHQDIRLTPGWR